MEENKNQNLTKEKKKTKKRVWIVLIFIALVAIYMFISIRANYLNVLELGLNYIEVFNKNIVYQYTVLAIDFLVVFLAVYLTNGFIKKGLKTFFEEDKIPMPKLPNKSIALVMGVLISIVISPVITEKAMLAFNPAWFATNDPIFGMDIGYFFFQKPFIELILYCLLGLVVILTIYTAIYYIVTFNMCFDGINLQTLKKNTFIKQINAYVMCVAVIIAGLTYLSTQGIMYQKFLNADLGSTTGIYGAGLTDVTIKVWGYRILAVVIIISVAFALRFLKKSDRKKTIISLAVIPAYLIVLFIIMTGFQLIFVNPNELDREKTYIAYNIQNTKKAYNINIEEKEIANSGAITVEQANNNDKLINNVPLITKDVTLKTLNEYQTSTGYYKYRNSNLATYSINGEKTLLYLSPREMISDSKRTYDSKTYEYTHGYGIILSDATKTDADGGIEYIQKDIDGSDSVIFVGQPRIYFGTETNSNIIVNAKGKKEFDYPITSSTNNENVYNGKAGLNLSFLDRLVIGITNGDFNLIFNSNITENTKIITNRNIIQRAKTLMPYLAYDEEPYIVVRDDGSLVWVLDAYTMSNSYPYSQESTVDKNGTKTKINYIRNSVKVLIDAYNGTTQFYITDRTDPIVMAYWNIYPELFMDLEEKIPEDIAKHIVYPKYLYNIQAQILTRYHNVQTEVLYRNDDTWSIAKISNGKNASQSIGTEMEPYYTMVKTIDSETPYMALTIPYTPEKKQNINAYLVGQYDNGNKLTLYKYKSDDNVLGVMQLEKQIEQDEAISQELENINTTGMRVQKSMIIVPIDNTLIYVEPIYQVRLNEAQIPALKKIIVASGNKIAIGNNLEEAIKNLLSQQAVEIELQDTETQEGLIQSIIKANNNLEESSNNNDWELMGKDINKLQELIKQLEKLVQEQEKNNIIDENIISNNTIVLNE